MNPVEEAYARWLRQPFGTLEEQVAYHDWRKLILATRDGIPSGRDRVPQHTQDAYRIYHGVC